MDSKRRSGVDERFEAALEQYRAGHTSAALAELLALISRDPTHADALHQLGLMAQERGDLQQAADYMQRALAHQPQNPALIYNLAKLAHDSHNIDAAIRLYQAAIALQPDWAMAHNNLGRAYASGQQADHAIAAYREAIRLAPQEPSYHFHLANALIDTGQHEQARQALRQLLAMQPENALAHCDLARITKYRSVDDHVLTMQALVARPDVAGAMKKHLHFALGKAFDDMGDYDEAFQHFKAGNALNPPSTKFHQHLDMMERTARIFLPDLFAPRSGWGSEDETPVFIVGMPRSGTTLVEQIITSHPQAAGAGELTLLSAIVDSIPSNTEPAREFPEAVEQLTARQITDMAGLYVANLKGMGHNALRITDKMPYNFQYLGLIALLFPRAKIIHCRRNPVDTCLSCYFQNFAQTQPFDNDLTRLGHYYRAYEQLMAHWRAVLPIPILEVSYESLIADQETAIRTIIGFCDLPWRAECLQFHAHRRVVKTSSHWQVRQPIYKTSVDRNLHYQKHLGELVEALRDRPQ